MASLKYAHIFYQYKYQTDKKFFFFFSLSMKSSTVEYIFCLFLLWNKEVNIIELKSTLKFKLYCHIKSFGIKISEFSVSMYS